MFRASQSEYAAALPLFDRALELDPAWDLLRLEQARAQVALGAAAAAMRTLKELPAAMRSGNAQYAELLGDALARLDRRDEAKLEWRRSLEIEPGNAHVRAKLYGSRP
jgi:predicted negative regulator of RcsB-dependent stress response